jgi:acyl-CoA reductase-like NAD-dependent aldehyde dehydrogenase
MSINWVSRAQEITSCIRNFVGGRQQPESGGEPIEKYSPRDGRLLYRFGAGVAGDVDRAVIAARHAFEDGEWSKWPVQRRKDVLLKLAALIERHCEELALLECMDVGKPIGDASSVDVPYAAQYIRFYAEAADKLHGRVYSADLSSLSYRLDRPVGVVAAVIGWNFPLALAAQKIGPALAAGNSLVLKPSELTSLSAARIAELAIEAGMPEGVFNVIHGGPVIGKALAHHHDVDLISFTGSSRTGKELLIAAGQSNMKRLILECGGKAPNIVFNDSPNLEAVADAVIARAFGNQGEVCTASSRLLIQESIKDEFLPLVIRRAAALVPGDPLDSETKFGALVSRRHQEKVQAYIQSGFQEGATCVYQSAAPAPHPGGFYVAPVIFDRVSPDQKIAQEEIFGPVLSVISFRDEDEAIRIANRTIYGLSAILWTKNLGRAHRLTQGLKAGWVVVNATEQPKDGSGVGVLAIGGHKESGISAEGGVEGLEEYMSKTAVQFLV